MEKSWEEDYLIWEQIKAQMFYQEKCTIRLATSYIVFSFAYTVLTMVVDNIYFDSNYYSDNFINHII